MTAPPPPSPPSAWASDPRLAAVLAALPVHLLVFDAEHRLVLSSGAVWQSLGFDPAVAPPGTPFPDFVRLLAFRGLYGPGDPETRAAAVLRTDRTRPSRRIVRGAHGRGFEIHSVPLPGDAGGGFLTCAIEITAHLDAEAEATARARRVEGVLARLQGGVGLYGPDHRLALFNPAYEAHNGIPAGGLRVGMTHAEVLQVLAAAGEFANADAEEAIRSRLALDRSRPHALQRERPTGEVLRVVSQPVPDGGFLVEVDDVMTLQRAEDEARHRVALLDDVLAALPHGVTVWGPDRRVALFNAAYSRIMQGAPIAVGDRLGDVIRRRAEAGEYGPGAAEEIERRELERSVYQQQARRRVRPDGSAIEVRTAPLPDGGYISVVTDITALHRAEAEASRRAAILSVMLENTRPGICLFDAEGTVVAANALAARMTGLSAEEMAPGRNIRELRRLQVARGEFGAGEAARDWRRRARRCSPWAQTAISAPVPTGRCWRSRPILRPTAASCAPTPT
jgi:PAS domain-containing protein